MASFDATADYYNPAPGIAMGLQLGHAIAQKKYQDQTLELAERKAAIEEQDALARRTKVQTDALQLSQDRDALKAFQEAYTSDLSEALQNLTPEQQADDEVRGKIEDGIFSKNIGKLPPSLVPKVLETAKQQRDLRNWRTESIRSKDDAAELRLLQSQLRLDARDLTMDQFVNRHLEGHAKRTGLSTAEAMRDLSQMWTANHGGGAPGFGDVPDQPPSLEQQLLNAKDAKVERVVIKGGEVTPYEGLNPWGGTDIDEAIKKQKVAGKIQGRGQAPAKPGAAKPSGGKPAYKWEGGKLIPVQ